MAKRKARNDMPPLSDQLRRAVVESGRTRYAIAQEANIDAAALHRFVNGGWLAALTMDALAKVLRLMVVSDRPQKWRTAYGPDNVATECGLGWACGQPVDV